jgi:hypothetical protein
VKSRQPLDLSKRRGGYGRVRSPSSRGREPLDRWSVNRQPSGSTGVARDLSPREQRETPEKTSEFWSSGFTQVKWLDFAFGRSPRFDLDHPSFGTRVRRSDEVGVHESRRSGISIGKPRHNLSRLFRETGVRNPRRVGISGIGKSEFLRTRKLGHHKSRNPGEIGTVHRRRTRGGNQRHREKSRQEVVDRGLSHRDIGDPGDKVFTHFGIANRETPTRKKVHRVASCQHVGKKGSTIKGTNCQ